MFICVSPRWTKLDKILDQMITFLNQIFTLATLHTRFKIKINKINYLIIYSFCLRMFTTLFVRLWVIFITSTSLWESGLVIAKTFGKSDWLNTNRFQLHSSWWIIQTWEETLVRTSQVKSSQFYLYSAKSQQKLSQGIFHIEQVVTVLFNLQRRNIPSWPSTWRQWQGKTPL